MTDASRYADWKAPADDGEFLIWPEPSALPNLIRDNVSCLHHASDVRLQQIPLAEIQSAARKLINAKPDQPVIASGHQIELYHAGVWVKDVLGHSLARTIDAQAYHFAVDTDAPKHLHLRWPGGSVPITDDPRLTSAESIQALANPTASHWQHVASTFDQAAAEWNFTPAVAPFLYVLKQAANGEHGLAPDLSHAIHQVDWDLGLRYSEFVTSPTWSSLPYLVYVCHMLARPAEFAGIYNSVLADYRRAHGIRTTARPMPDLVIAENSVEMPFWGDYLSSGRRSRFAMSQTGNAVIFQLNGDHRFELDPSEDGWKAAGRLQAFCREHDFMISPRALSLTMYFRLFLSDLFIHGIGGGRYDQVTDEVVRRWLGIEPPRFAVTTATLYFPAAAGQHRINLRPLLQEGRRIRHGLFSAEKHALVKQIESLPRGTAQRQELFYRMHEHLAAHADGPARKQWEQRLAEAERESHAQKSLFDRELFFAIQPRERLEQMIGKYEGQLSR